MGQTMTIVTDWDIQAFLDNELTDDEQAAVLRALREDTDLRRRFNALRRQRELLQQWWQGKDH